MNKDYKQNKQNENYIKNIELLQQFTSTRTIKDLLSKLYDGIDDVVDVVFYSLISPHNEFASFYNVTRAQNFVELTNHFAKANIIPIYHNRFANEYIGYHVLRKRFFKVSFKQPSGEYQTEELFEQQAYFVVLQSSKFDFYCNLNFIKQEYEDLIDKVTEFIKSDKKFKKFLSKIEYKEPTRKRNFLSNMFAEQKQMSLFYGVVKFMSSIRVESPYVQDAEKMVSLSVLDYLGTLLRVN